MNTAPSYNNLSDFAEEVLFAFAKIHCRLVGGKRKFRFCGAAVMNGEANRAEARTPRRRVWLRRNSAQIPRSLLRGASLRTTL